MARLHEAIERHVMQTNPQLAHVTAHRWDGLYQVRNPLNEMGRHVRERK